MKLCLFTLLLLIACNSGGNNENTQSQVSEEQILKKEINQHPDSLLLKENLIQYYRESGDYQKAISFTESLIKADTGNARLYYILGTLEYENEDTITAIENLNKAATLDPLPDHLLFLTTIYAETKNDSALLLADLMGEKKMIAEEKVFFIKGLFYNYSGDKNKCIEFMNKCLAINFTNMDAYREKAIALYDLGKYDDALLVLDKAVTLQNSFSEGHYYRGRCLEKLNRTDEAAEAYQTALMYDANYSEAKDALNKLQKKITWRL